MEHEDALVSSQPLPTNSGCLSQTQVHNAKIQKRSTVLTLAVIKAEFSGFNLGKISRYLFLNFTLTFHFPFVVIKTTDFVYIYEYIN